MIVDAVLILGALPGVANLATDPAADAGDAAVEAAVGLGPLPGALGRAP